MSTANKMISIVYNTDSRGSIVMNNPLHKSGAILSEPMQQRHTSTVEDTEEYTKITVTLFKRG